MVPEIAREAAGGYDALFIDEYQDISHIQEAVIRNLHDSRNSLFMVGDVKQSIYRFRLADPQPFSWPTTMPLTGRKRRMSG